MVNLPRINPGSFGDYRDNDDPHVNEDEYSADQWT
jgi:hypothetical protein